MVENAAMDDLDPRISKILLSAELLGTVLNLADSLRTRGPLRTGTLLALSIGLPAMGEVLVTGPLGLLRHRLKPQVKGVPVAVLLLWYNVICGTHTATERALTLLPFDASRRREALPLGTVLAATSLDLIMDPFGLDAGLWEWKVDGAYAPEVVGTNGRRGVPVLNYLGWFAVVMCVSLSYTKLFPRGASGSRLPVLLLLPHYLLSAGWAIGRRKPAYLLYSMLFPLVTYLGLEKES